VAHSGRSTLVHRAWSCRVKFIHGQGREVRIGWQCSRYFHRWYFSDAQIWIPLPALHPNLHPIPKLVTTRRVNIKGRYFSSFESSTDNWSPSLQSAFFSIFWLRTGQSSLTELVTNSRVYKVTISFLDLILIDYKLWCPKIRCNILVPFQSTELQSSGFIWFLPFW
jgi:hypothetical protein